MSKTNYSYSEWRTYAEDLTEEDGFMLFNALKNKFQWAGTVFCRDDMDSVYIELTEDDPYMPDSMSDELWEKAQRDYAWRHMDEMLSETGYETMRLIVEDLLK